MTEKQGCAVVKARTCSLCGVPLLGVPDQIRGAVICMWCYAGEVFCEKGEAADGLA